MSEMSIPDRAAAVVAKANQFAETVERLRAKDPEAKWTELYMANMEACEMAHVGLQRAWAMLDRLDQIARMMLKEPKP